MYPFIRKRKVSCESLRSSADRLVSAGSRQEAIWPYQAKSVTGWSATVPIPVLGTVPFSDDAPLAFTSEKADCPLPLHGPLAVLGTVPFSDDGSLALTSEKADCPLPMLG